MKSTQEKILKTFDIILETKKGVFETYVKPTETDYKNLSFAGRAKDDEINQALLDDIQAAADAAEVTVTIDYARTGHDKYTSSNNVSRHYTGNAVDIDFIGGKAVSKKNREIVNKFVDELVKLGYEKNKEYGNPKAVLTFGFPNHDNHVHVSNKTNTPSVDIEKTDDITKKDNTNQQKFKDIVKTLEDLPSDEKTIDKVKDVLAGSGLLATIVSNKEVQDFINSQDWLKDFLRFFPELQKDENK